MGSLLALKEESPMETNTVNIWNYVIIRYASFGTMVRANDQVCIILLYFCLVVQVHLHIESTKSLDKYLFKEDAIVMFCIIKLKKC